MAPMVFSDGTSLEMGMAETNLRNLLNAHPHRKEKTMWIYWVVLWKLILILGIQDNLRIVVCISISLYFQTMSLECSNLFVV